MKLQWKIRQSALWKADHEEWTADCAEFSEPEVSQEAGDEGLHLLDADGFAISPDIATEGINPGEFHQQCALVEFEAWASTRKGHCRVCGNLKVEVDTTDGGIEQSSITVRCPHGVLVVQYRVVGDIIPRSLLADLRHFTSRDTLDACPYCRGKQAWLRERAADRGATCHSPPGRVSHACPHHATLAVVLNYVAWLTHEPHELICTRRVRRGFYFRPPRSRELVLSRPIPPFGSEDPIPAQSLTMRAFAGVKHRIGGFEIRSRKYRTSTGRRDPEFPVLLRLYRAAHLLPRQETTEE